MSSGELRDDLDTVPDLRGCAAIFAAVAPPGAREMPSIPPVAGASPNITTAPRSAPIRRGSRALSNEFPSDCLAFGEVAKCGFD